MDNHRQHLEKLRIANQRRLQTLELQSASFGISVPPHVATEIEDIRNELFSIDKQLASYSAPVKISSTRSIFSILFLSSDPKNASRLRLAEEFREIQEKLQLAQLREKFELHERGSLRPVDMSQALLDINPQFVHFSGHGTANNELCFENQLGEVHVIKPDALAALFEQFSNQIDCVILNACYSEEQANSIAKHIDYVIGMEKAIGDKAAIAFSIGFYQALGAGRTIKEAYKLGCVQIRLQNIDEHSTPVLIKRAQT
ncbi:CHAT domain-containing protein [Leptolyngbya subtilissima ST-M1]|uniref:CHAT domain-containing protein n=1 Tax=Cyanophyceae TaxID=3028117 RepID=UPI0018F049BA|nr:CHAT domain-containing protein [Nodosilinea sp. FACHB-131]